MQRRYRDTRNSATGPPDGIALTPSQHPRICPESSGCLDASNARHTRHTTIRWDPPAVHYIRLNQGAGGIVHLFRAGLDQRHRRDDELQTLPGDAERKSPGAWCAFPGRRHQSANRPPIASAAGTSHSSRSSASSRNCSSLRFTRCSALSTDLTCRPISSAISW